MGISKTQALLDIQALTNPTVQDIKNIVATVDANVQTGNTTLFYSQMIGDKEGWRVVEKIAEGNSKVSFINNTQVSALLNDDTFKDILDSAITADNTTNGTTFTSVDIMNGTTTGGVRNADGFWDVASKSLAENASGDVKTLSSYASSDSIFVKTELAILINNTAVTSIDGVPRATLLNALNTSGVDEAFDLIQVNSFANAAQLRISFNPDNSVNAVGTHKLYDGTAIPDSSPPVDSVSGAKLMSGMDSFTWNSIKASATKLAAVGVVADVALGLITFYDAYQAYDSGDTDGAFTIITNFFIDLVEETVGVSLGVLFASPVTAALIAAGGWVAVGGIALGFVAAVAGGYLASEFLDLRQMTEDLGFTNGDIQNVTFTLNGADYTLQVNDVYYNGIHTMGEDEFFGFLDNTPNLVSGDTNYNTLTGTDDEDILLGTANDDIIDGGDDVDVIVGNAGNDTIIASACP